MLQVGIPKWDQTKLCPPSVGQVLALRSTGKRQLPLQDAVGGLLVEALVELGEFSGACLQELLAHRKECQCH